MPVSKAKPNKSVSTAHAASRAALGEVIDNSLEANANQIKIELREVQRGKRKAIDRIVVADDGDGMSDNVLHHHLQLGFSTRYMSESTIGKFGLVLLRMVGGPRHPGSGGRRRRTAPDRRRVRARRLTLPPAHPKGMPAMTTPTPPAPAPPPHRPPRQAVRRSDWVTGNSARWSRGSWSTVGAQTPRNIAAALDVRSSGAVGNALKLLAERGEAEVASTAPLMYRATAPTAFAAAPTITPVPSRTPRPKTPKPTTASAPTTAATTTPAPSGAGGSAAGSAGVVTGPVKRPNRMDYHPRLLSGMPDVTALRWLRDG